MSAATSAAETTPLCPVTGEPAVRRVQWVASRLLADLWRIAAKVARRPEAAERRRYAGT